METRTTSFWYSPVGVLALLFLVVVFVFAGFLAYAPIARAWWIGRLTHEDGKVAEKARKYILGMGDHAVPSLCGLLDSADQEKRREAAVLLCEMNRHEVTIPFWRERLTSGNAEYVADAQEHLAAMGAKAITDIKLLLESGDLRRRFAAYEACLKMGRRDLAPMALQMDYELDRAAFPRGRIEFNELAAGKKYGDIIVIAAYGLANENEVLNIRKDENTGYIKPARDQGFDALMRGQVILFDYIQDIASYREFLRGVEDVPLDEDAEAVWRKVKDAELLSGENRIENRTFADVLSIFRRNCGVNVVIDPGAVDTRPVTIGVQRVPGDAFLDMLTLHRGLAWRVMGPAVVVYDPAGDAARFELTDIPEKTLEDFPGIAGKLEAGIPLPLFDFRYDSFQVALDCVAKTSGLTIVPMADVDLAGRLDLTAKNVKMRHALDYLVKVVAGCYWFVSDGAILVSRTAPTPGKPGKRPGASPLAGRFPEIMEVLGTKDITANFDNTKLTEVAKFLREISGVHVFLDPGYHMAPPSVSVQVAGLKMKDVLNIVSKYAGCTWDVRFGGVYMAPREELDRVPRFIPIPVDLPGRLEAKLNGRISLDLEAIPLAKVVEDLKKMDVPIRIGIRAKRSGSENAIISCNLQNHELRYALEAVLLPVPAGLSWKLEKGEIVIVPR